MGTTGIGAFRGSLDTEQAAPIFDEIRRRSVIQQLGKEECVGSGEVTALPISSVSAVEEGPPRLDELRLMKQGRLVTTMSLPAEDVPWGAKNGLQGIEGQAAAEIAISFDVAALYGRLRASSLFWEASFPAESYLAQTPHRVLLSSATSMEDGVGVDYLEAKMNLVAGSQGEVDFAAVLGPRAQRLLTGSTPSDAPLSTSLPEADTHSVSRGLLHGGWDAVVSKHVEDDDCLGFVGPFAEIVWGRSGGIDYHIWPHGVQWLHSEATPQQGIWFAQVEIAATFGIRIEDTSDFIKLVE